MPVVGRVDPIQRRDMRITVRRRHFQPEPAVVGDRLQRVHGVQFPAGLVRVVHPVDAQAQLEAQFRLVAKTLRDLRQQLAADVQGQLVAVHHDRLNRVVEFDSVALQCLGQPVGDVVEVAAVGARATAGERDLAHQPSVSGGVAGARRPRTCRGARRSLRPRQGVVPPPRWLPVSGPGPVSSSQKSVHLDRRSGGQRRLLGLGDGAFPVDAQRHFLNLLVQLEDCVQQHLRAGRAPG